MRCAQGRGVSGVRDEYLGRPPEANGLDLYTTLFVLEPDTLLSLRQDRICAEKWACPDWVLGIPTLRQHEATRRAMCLHVCLDMFLEVDFLVRCN